MDVTTEGGPPDEASILASLSASQPAPQTAAASTSKADPFNAPRFIQNQAVGALMPLIPPDVSRGVAQEVGKTAIGAAQLAAGALRHVPGVRNYVPDAATFDNARARLAPENTQQKIGQGATQAAAFFVPAAGLTKLKAAAQTGVGLLDALAGAGIEGASAAGVSSVQQGTTKDALTTGALTAGTVIGMQAGMKVAAPGLKWVGERVEKALVKPTTADVRDGFQIGNIFRYNLGGSLSQTYDKTQAAIQAEGAKLKAVTNISTQLGRKVNLLDELTSVAVDLEKGSAKNFGQNASIQGAVQKLLDDPLFQKIGGNGDMDLSTANEVKQAVGELGAWLHDPSGRVMTDPASKAMETVANALYSKLKTSIAQQAIGPITDINRKLSELIPIRQAIIRRIPVDQRANFLNLGDLIGYSTGAYGLALANRLLRSGQFADIAQKGGQLLEAASPMLAPAAGRLTGAAATGGNQ